MRCERCNQPITDEFIHISEEHADEASTRDEIIGFIEGYITEEPDEWSAEDQRDYDRYCDRVDGPYDVDKHYADVKEGE